MYMHREASRAREVTCTASLYYDAYSARAFFFAGSPAASAASASSMAL